MPDLRRSIGSVSLWLAYLAAGVAAPALHAPHLRRGAAARRLEPEAG